MPASHRLIRGLPKRHFIRVPKTKGIIEFTSSCFKRVGTGGHWRLMPRYRELLGREITPGEARMFAEHAFLKNFGPRTGRINIGAIPFITPKGQITIEPDRERIAEHWKKSKGDS